MSFARRPIKRTYLTSNGACLGQTYSEVSKK
jgi:hypothetical protein